MFKIVGKIFVFFLQAMIFFVDAHVSMEIRTDGGVKDHVIVGQPFILDVIINDLSGSIQAPAIKGLDRFGAKRTGMYMSNINGRSTTRYSYQVRIDEVGSYTLGPAVITHNKKNFISNEVVVTVLKDLDNGAISDKKDNQSAPFKSFLRLMVDTESAVVGQKIGCTLRFYYQDPSLSLHNIGMPELPNFDIKEIGKLESGTAEVDGIIYHYAQWRWDMYPVKSGEFIIPAYHADYDVPKKESHTFSNLFMLIGKRVDRKRVYSNAITIKVRALPHCDREVNAVGIFERISAKIEPCFAKEGEGMVFALEIEGIGNLQSIATPTLKIPQSLKYYDSHSTIIQPKHDDDLPIKRFEFIVQGMQSGDYQIPEQLFTYFDIEKNTFITLCSAPLSVSITPNNTTIQKNTDVIINSSNPLIEHQEDVAGINVVGQWYPIASSPMIPWWLFIILFIAPGLYLFLWFVFERFNGPARLMRRRVFKQARQDIDASIKSANDKNLYIVFTNIFQFLQEDNDFGDYTIVLRKNGFSDQMIAEWNDFLHQITHAAYSRSENKSTHELCRMAKQWIDCLEKII